jgi:5-formyltetrahydrofolate cyclo-ligase
VRRADLPPPALREGVLAPGPEADAGACGAAGMRSEKAAVRAAWVAWRRALTPDDVGRRSARIRVLLAAWPVVAWARGVLGYRSLRGEPDLDPLLAALAGRGVSVWLPGPDPRPEALIPWDGAARAPNGPPAIQVALVPGVAFDWAGGRLGRGRGYYDRLLPALSPTTLRVGVCFHRQVVLAVPRDPWDVVVDWLVTEDGLWRGGGRLGEPVGPRSPAG